MKSKKAFKKEVIQNLVLTSERFGIEVEMTAKLAKAKTLSIWEVLMGRHNLSIQGCTDEGHCAPALKDQRN